MKSRLIVLGLLLLMVVGCANAATPEQSAEQPPAKDDKDSDRSESASIRSGGVEIIGGDGDALRLFVEQYMGVFYGTDVTTHITLGALPDDLPFEIPIPDNATITGSVTRSSGMQADLAPSEVLLTSSDTPQEVIDFYVEAFEEAEWMVQSEDNRPGGGFMPAPMPSASFCLEEEETRIDVQAVAVDDETQVRMYIMTSGKFASCQEPGIMYEGESINLIPNLAPPEGVSMQMMGGGGGPGEAETSARLSTAVPAADLHDHFAKALEDAGWERMEYESSEFSAWSIWSFRDDEDREWIGLLLIVGGESLFDQLRASIWIERQ